MSSLCRFHFELLSLHPSSLYRCGAVTSVTLPNVSRRRGQVRVRSGIAISRMQRGRKIMDRPAA